jgi:hypothetical protein
MVVICMISKAGRRIIEQVVVVVVVGMMSKAEFATDNWIISLIEITKDWALVMWWVFPQARIW